MAVWAIAGKSLTITTVLFLLGMLAGLNGPVEWGSVRVTLIALSSFALLVVATAPEHRSDACVYVLCQLGRTPT